MVAPAGVCGRRRYGTAVLGDPAHAERWRSVRAHRARTGDPRAWRSHARHAGVGQCDASGRRPRGRWAPAHHGTHGSDRGAHTRARRRIAAAGRSVAAQHLPHRRGHVHDGQLALARTTARLHAVGRRDRDGGPAIAPAHRVGRPRAVVRPLGEPPRRLGVRLARAVLSHCRSRGIDTHAIDTHTGHAPVGLAARAPVALGRDRQRTGGHHGDALRPRVAPHRVAHPHRSGRRKVCRRVSPADVRNAGRCRVPDDHPRRDSRPAPTAPTASVVEHPHSPAECRSGVAGRS